MWHHIKLYALLVPIALIIDLTWLGVVMSGFYKAELGNLARRSGEALSPIWWAAILVYLLIPLGILLFALPRVAPGGATGSAIFWGLLYGLVLYGVYDLTNYSTLAGWPLRLTFYDIAWGGVLCAVLTWIAARLDAWIR